MRKEVKHMPLVKDEQEVKRTTQFLAYETGDQGNMLMLKSHLYQIVFHFLESVKRSVACRKDECLYCAANYAKRVEYNYMVWLNGEIGFIDIRASVFFSMQGIAKAQKRDMRQMSWTVIKSGEGLLTKYTVSKDDNLSKEDYDNLLAEIDDNTTKLVEWMERHEEDLDQNYVQYMSQIRKQTVAKKPDMKEAVEEKTATPVIEDEPDPEGPEDDSETVRPDQIPF